MVKFLRPNFTGTRATTSPRLSAWTRSTPAAGASKSGVTVGVGVAVAFGGVLAAGVPVCGFRALVAVDFFGAGVFDFFDGAVAVGFGDAAAVTVVAVFGSVLGASGANG